MEFWSSETTRAGADSTVTSRPQFSSVSGYSVVPSPAGARPGRLHHLGRAASGEADEDGDGKRAVARARMTGMATGLQVCAAVPRGRGTFGL